MGTKKIVFKRCSLSLDLRTIARCKELAKSRAQSISGLIQLLVAQAYENEPFRTD